MTRDRDQSIVWRPTAERDARSRTRQFMEQHGISEYAELAERSTADPEWFWAAVVDFLAIRFSRPFDAVLDRSAGPEWPKWFVGGAVNVAAGCLADGPDSDPNAPALVWESEDGRRGQLTLLELRSEVARAAGALGGLGVGPGDTVGLYLPIGREAVVSFLSVAWLGAIAVPIFSGFGAPAVASRLVDAGAATLVTASGFSRRGRRVAMKTIADTAVADLAAITAVLVVDHDGTGASTEMRTGRDHWWHDAMARASPVPPAETGSETPFYLAYTSGTTGRPKGVVHVHGGFPVKVAAEAAFHTDFGPGDNVSWVTDMGWVMGPWLVIGGLLTGATVTVYDGAPDHPDPGRLWRFAAAHQLTHLGVSPTLIRALQAADPDGARDADLGSLRTFGSTGEPWNPDPWWWLFEHVGRRQVPIVNISGGTEVGATFLGVNLLQGVKPVAVGGPSLGIAADVYDDAGRPIREGVGELVCTQPWPGITRGIWGDDQRYLDTYWSRFEGVWVHGDWASIDADGFWFLHGRSDDTLNVAGKRIGPAEIESVAVARPEVQMAAAVGVPDEVKGEVIALYVVPGREVDRDELCAAISDDVVTEFGKAFRPYAVVPVEDLPRTRSAKIVRRAVRAAAIGEDLGDLSSLENPESLALIEILAPG